MNYEMTTKQLLDAAEPASRYVPAATAELITGLANAVRQLTEQRDVLAAHEQEPVYLVGPIEDERGRNRRLWFEVPATNWMAKAFYRHPAPVPVVPDAIKWPAEKFCPAEYAGSLLWNETEIWNKAVEACQDAYRAAMLNGGKSERDKVRAVHAEWSQKTFGNVGPVGPLKHLAKEANEAADAPDDLSEWADMQFLLWDAQRRAGITDEQINQAMLEKLALNKAREWPEPKDGEPRLHIKSAEGGSQ